MAPQKIKPFRLTRAIERRRHRERYQRFPNVLLTLVADRTELGPQPEGPIEWTKEAHQAFHTEYHRFRRWPGMPLYPHLVIANCLTAVWRAQALPLIQFTSIETDAWAHAHYRGCEDLPLPYPGGHEERSRIIKARSFDAALAAYHEKRVSAFKTREELRALLRARRVEQVKMREAEMLKSLRDKAKAFP